MKIIAPPEALEKKLGYEGLESLLEILNLWYDAKVKESRGEFVIPRYVVPHPKLLEALGEDGVQALLDWLNRLTLEDLKKFLPHAESREEQASSEPGAAR